MRKIQTKFDETKPYQQCSRNIMYFIHNKAIYYCDEFPMEVEDNIIQVDDESQSDFSEMQSQYLANSSRMKSDFSGLSSDYHVKATFKQILGRNAMNALANQQNKRDELMGKKKNHVLKKLLRHHSMRAQTIYYLSNRTCPLFRDDSVYEMLDKHHDKKKETEEVNSPQELLVEQFSVLDSKYQQSQSTWNRARVVSCWADHGMVNNVISHLSV